MAESGEMKTIVEVETASPLPPAVKRPRRCVQSKLSWLVPQAEEGEREDPSESEEEREGKKKRRRKSRAPKKSLVTNNDARGLNRGKNLHEKNKKEQHDAVPLKAGIGKCSIAAESKASSKNCRQVKNKKMPPKKVATPKKRTPKKVATPFMEPNSEQRFANKSCAKKNLFGENLHTSLPLLDLRLEAKIAAEENVRLSAGKQIHPFFTCSKAAKRVSEGQDLTKVETRWSVLDGDFLDSSTPIHVFDTLGDDVVSLNWRNWVFLDRTSQDLHGYHALESTLSVFKGSVEPLKLDTVSCVGMNLSKLSNGVVHALPDGEDRKEKVHVSMGDSFSSRCVSNVGNLDNDQQDNLFNERLASYYQRCSYSPRCSLWTSKYRPENALEVCGNKESITSLNLWLKSWHERGVESSKGFTYGDKNATEDGEDSLYEIESDMEEIDDNAILKNVLLITGPIGSGKSAAIYACAKEQGFEVIEVNASDVRNGSHIKQKYGEATESHGFNRWSSEDPIGPRRKNILELLSSPPETAEGKEIEYGSPEMISRACNQDSVPAECSLDVMESTAVSSQVANKSLILFEDVDTVFNEDRGFISSILQLADTAKRPIILTSNNKNPVLPHVLDRSVLDFTLPSSSELLPHLHLICASEKALVSYHLLKQLFRLCLGDIRKTLLLLQFWCQGNEGTERKMQFTYSPLPCDVDAAHLVMPRLIPWEFKCELSQKVEEEISKTISALEEKSRFMESTELIGVLNVGNGVASHITCKKNRRLKRNHAMLDQSEVSAHDLDLEDFSDVQESPVKCARQAVKRRPGRILCSQSEDDDLPPAENSEEVIDPVYKSLGDDVAQNHFENLETSPSHICDTFQLQDLSCVPESSFISVAETVNEVSSNNMSATFADFIKLIHVAPEGVGFLDRAIVESSACSLHGNEEQGDFQNEDGELPANAFHLLDECSRVDFSMGLVPGKNSIYTPEVESVQETWRKLRDVREGLKPYLTSNLRDACSILKLASSLTDLVCETDIMLDACTPLISDILEPSRTPFVEPDAFSWYEEQLEMGSTYAQHGLRFYTNKCSLIGSNLGCENTLNLSQEMLASSNNTMALGKLLTHGNSLRQDSHIHGDLNRDEPGCGISSGRGLVSELYNAVLPVVPKRTSMTLRGPAFHDYLSFMSQISKSEYSRLSESTNNNHRRRSRGSKHYLSSGSVQLSPEHLELLARQFS